MNLSRKSRNQARSFYKRAEKRGERRDTTRLLKQHAEGLMGQTSALLHTNFTGSHDGGKTSGEITYSTPDLAIESPFKQALK